MILFFKALMKLILKLFRSNDNMYVKGFSFKK